MKGWAIGLAAVIVCFILGVSFIVPIFNKQEEEEIEDIPLEFFEVPEPHEDEEDSGPTLVNFTEGSYLKYNYTYPENSFGFKPDNLIFINESYFENWTMDNQFWRLKYSLDKSYGSWVDCTENLSVDYDWNGTNCKMTLNVSSTPENAYYRLDYAFNASLKSSMNRTSQYIYNLNFTTPDNETYYCQYDWSDIFASNWSDKLNITTGKKTVAEEDYFWFRAETINKIGDNRSFEIDPSFGNTNTTSNYLTSNDVWYGNEHNVPVDMTVTSVFWYTKRSFSACNANVALAYHDNETDAWHGTCRDIGTSVDWHEWEISGGLNLSQGDSVDMLGNSESLAYYYYEAPSCDTVWDGDTNACDGIINGALNLMEGGDRFFCIYAEYEEISANNAPTFSNEYPANQTVSALQPRVGVTVTDADAEATTVNFYVGTNPASLSWAQANASVASGTNVTFQYNGACTADTNYYWKVTADDGTDNSTVLYNFTTAENATREYQSLDAGYFIFNNISSHKSLDDGYFIFSNTSSYKNLDEGYFIFNNASGNYQSLDSGYFLFSNTSSYKTLDSGFFLFSNTSGYKSLDSGYFIFNNVSSYKDIDSGYFIFNSEGVAYQSLDAGYFIFSNTSGYKDLDSGYFLFSNTSSYKNIDDGYFIFSNTTISFNTLDSGYFIFNNISSYKNLDSGYFIFASEVQEYQDLDSGYFIFNNNSDFRDLDSGYFIFDNISLFRNLDSGYFVFSNKTDSPTSYVNDLPYLISENPYTITATAANEPTNVTLFYRYSGNNGSASTVSLFDDFESGFGHYTDGGEECLRVNPNQIYGDSTWCIKVDGDAASSYFNLTDPILCDSEGYDKIEITFDFKMNSGVDNGEGFDVDYYNTSISDWSTIKEFRVGGDYSADTAYLGNHLYLNETDGYNLSDQFQIRFYGKSSSETTEYTHFDTIYLNSTKSTNWTEWFNHSADTSSPWSWDFAFPNGTGYYEFYSIADADGEFEDAPEDADADCYYWVREMQDLDSGYFIFSNTSSFKDLDSGYFIFNNASNYNNLDSGYFLFSNTSGYQSINSGYFIFNNITSFSSLNSGYFIFSNISSYKSLNDGYFIFNNVSSYKDLDSGYFLFTNTSIVDYYNLTDGYFIFKNNTALRSQDSGWFWFKNYTAAGGGPSVTVTGREPDLSVAAMLVAFLALALVIFLMVRRRRNG